METPHNLGPEPPEMAGLSEKRAESLLILTRLELKKAFSAIQKGTLQHRDLTVLLIYVCRSDWKTGRVRYSAELAANELGVTKSYIYQSLRRLSASFLLIPFQDKQTGERMRLVNPYLVKCGGNKSRPYLIRVFEEAANGNT